MNTAQKTWLVCNSIASVFPGSSGVEATARLLFGTAATESGFRLRRQTGYSITSKGGAFGLWQIELPTFEWVYMRLMRSPDFLSRARKLLAQDPWHEENGIRIGVTTTQRYLDVFQEEHGDTVNGLFARLIYWYKTTDPLPATVPSQARYYKKHYNTSKGKGSVEKYMSDWATLCEPVLKEK